MSRDRSTPRVSVYVTTRNRRALLERALRSVQAQTWPHWDLIVVNDGSNDDTRPFLDELSASDGRVTVIHHDQSMGAPRSRNEAILAASGDYVTGLDDDDFFRPSRLEWFVESAERLAGHGAQFSFLYAQDEYLVGDTVVSSTAKDSGADFTAFFKKNPVGNQVFARKSVFVDAGLFDEALPAWQDLDLFMRMRKAGGRPVLVDVATYVFDVTPRGDRITASSPDRILAAFDMVVAKHPEVAGELKQRLLLQTLRDTYGVPVNPAFLKRYASFGRTPKAAYLLARALAGRGSKISY